MYQNLHVHTWRCKHASGTEEEYVERAIAAGFTDIGFSDHSPQPEELENSKGGIHAVRMDMSQLEEYVKKVHELRDRYADKINIRCGIELEYFPKYHKQMVELLRAAGIEYFILGEHYLTDGEVSTGNPTDSDEHLREYVDLVLEGAATGDFCIAAHPDLIYYTGSDEVYEREMTRLAEGLKKLDIPAEINFYGIFKKRNYPDMRFWKIVAKTGNRVCFDSDAHAPELMWNEEVYNIAKGMTDELGLDLITKVLD